MKGVWTKGLKHHEAEQLKQEFKSARDLLRILDRILAEKEKKARTPEASEVVDTGTPYRITDKNGYIRAINEVRKLIEPPKE